MNKTNSKKNKSDIFTIVAELLLELGPDTRDFKGFYPARRVNLKKIKTTRL